MAFDWMQVVPNPAFVATLAAKRQAMYVGELAERASLLMRLGFGRDATRRRLAGRVQWDFAAVGEEAPFLKQLDEILDRTFQRGSRKS